MDEARLTAWLREKTGDASLGIERAALLSGGAIQHAWAGRVTKSPLIRTPRRNAASASSVGWPSTKTQ